MMFSAMDWHDLDHIHRAAQAAGISCWVRVPANPWLSGTGQLQVTVDVQRAFSIGILLVGASVASAEQVRACIEVSRDWHRSGTGEYPTTNETFAAMHSKAADAAVFVPHVEAGTAVRELDEIIAIDGVRKLYQHGVRICLMQGADSMLENFAKSLLTDIRGAIG